jgi:hypothetical protein
MEDAKCEQAWSGRQSELHQAVGNKAVYIHSLQYLCRRSELTNFW